MKKLNILLIALFVTLGLCSCKLRETNPRINASPGTFSITSPKTDLGYTLDKSKENDTLLTFTWSEPDYGVSVAPNYLVVMDTSKTPSTHAVTVGSTSDTSLSITVGKMNSKLLGAGIAGGQVQSFQVSVISTLGDSLKKVTSKPITLYFQPFAVCKYCPEIYMPGNYQAVSGYGANWSPPDAPALHTVSGKDVYEGYVYIGGHNPDDPNIQFKFTPERNFDAAFGAGSKPNTLDPNGGNISITDTAYYQVDVDLNKLTYTLTKTTWALLGDAANGWDDDIPMTYEPDKKVWVKTLDLKQAEIKFRANGNWDINFGAGSSKGILAFNSSDNIAVPSAGKYKVTLNLNDYPRTYTLEEVK
jgi:hypothetical protein